MALKAFRADDNEDVRGVGSRRVNKTVSIREQNIGAIGEPLLLTPVTRKAFNQLRQAFIKTPILRHFDLESHIRIKTDALGYTISGVLS